MAEKQKGRRQTRKAVQEQFNGDFDLARLDYDRLASKAKGRARLTGVGVAAVLYLLGFGAAFVGWQNGRVDDDALARVVWLWMVPTSVIGSFAWLVTESRRLYPVRRAMADYLADCEAGNGRLWRYGPMVRLKPIKNVDVDTALALSRRGEGERIDPQDYAAMVNALAETLRDANAAGVTAEVIQEVADNLDQN